MDEVVDFERDFRRVKQGDTLIYTTLLVIKPDLSEPRLVPELLAQNETEPSKQEANEKVENKDEQKQEHDHEEDSDDTGDSDEDDDDDESGDDDEEGKGSEEEGNEGENKNSKLKKKDKFKHPDRPRDESPNSRKVSLA